MYILAYACELLQVSTQSEGAVPVGRREGTRCVQCQGEQAAGGNAKSERFHRAWGRASTGKRRE